MSRNQAIRISEEQYRQYAAGKLAAKDLDFSKKSRKPVRKKRATRDLVASDRVLSLSAINRPPMITFELPRDLPLLGELIRMRYWEYSRQRKALAQEVAILIRDRLGKAWNWAPYHRAEITITRFAPGGAPDPDNLNASSKMLLDILQPMHPRRSPNGLGVIANDSGDCIVLRHISHWDRQAKTSVSITECIFVDHCQQNVYNRSGCEIKTQE